MINLDDIKNGDTVVVETTAFVCDKEISLNNDVIRYATGVVTDEKWLKVISHTAKAIDEPTNFGAVAEGVWKSTGKTHRWVNTGNNIRHLKWRTSDFSNSWSEISRNTSNLTVLSEGVPND